MSESNGKYQSETIDLSDLTPIRVYYKIGKSEFFLIEASEDADCKYRNKLMKATKLDQRGRPVGMEDIADADPFLLSLCLYKITDKSEEGEPTKYEPVSDKTIRTWPARLVKKLITKLKEISDMETQEEETVESLVDQIRELQERLAILRGDEESKQETVLKND